MSIEIQEPEILFPEGFDERWEYEMSLKGYLYSVTVRVEDGSSYLVNFIDPIRLSQDLEVETTEGRPYLAEPGMIILPEITREAIVSSVKALWHEGFFDGLKPLLITRNGQA